MGSTLQPGRPQLASGSFDETARHLESRRAKRRCARAATPRQWSGSITALTDGCSRPAATIRRYACGARATDAAMRTIDAGNHVYKLAFSPDGSWLASAGRARSAIGTLLVRTDWPRDGSVTPVKIWRGRRRRARRCPASSDRRDSASSFSPDGRIWSTQRRCWRRAIVAASGQRR